APSRCGAHTRRRSSRACRSAPGSPMSGGSAPPHSARSASGRAGPRRPRMPADALVVGAGPAGAATSILLAEQGLSVVRLDPARFPRDKICGEYLSPEASRILERLDVLPAIEAGGARPLRGMRVFAPDGTVLVGDYPTDGPWRGHRAHALAVRRRALD